MTSLFHAVLHSRRRRALSLVLVVLFASAATPAVARNQATGATPGPLVHLPADQGAHPSAENEWWYVVGHLRSGGHTFGYEVTVFHLNHLLPPGFTTPLNLYRTDVAITDESGHRFYHAITPYFPQSASTSTGSLDVRVGQTSLAGTSLQNMSLAASLAGGSFRLKLSSRRTPLLVGGRGYLPFGTGYTYYYSLTDLATSGSLRLGARTYKTVGLSWLDHQWGNWSWATVSGWTWTCVQLSNGVQLSAFDFRGYSKRTRGANMLLNNGRLILRRQLTFVPSGRWRSPHTRGNYPASERLQIPGVQLDVRITPTIADQEMVWTQAKRGSYWEGSATVSGAYQGKRVTGEAYLELTGYAKG